jgi:CHAT domain-containing protein
MKQVNCYRLIFIIIFSLLIHNRGNAQEEIVEDSAVVDQVFDISQIAFYYYTVEINLDSAEFYLKRAIDLAYSSRSYKIGEGVANNLITLAAVYRKINENRKAMSCLNQAENILKSTDPDNILFGYIYHNKGNIYKDLNDLFSTKEYYEYALDFYTRIGYLDNRDFAIIYSNYIKLLLDLGEDELAEKKLSVVDIDNLKFEPYILNQFYITKATSHSQLGNFEEALFYFKKVQKTINKLNRSNEYINQIIRFYYSYIDFYILYSVYDKALLECDHALQYIESLDPQATKGKIRFQSNILYRSAIIQHRLGIDEQALKLVNVGINNLQEFLKSLSFGETENEKRKDYTTSLPDLYILKSRVLFTMFNQSNDFDDLVRSYESYQQTVETLNDMKLAMINEDSRVFATSQIIEVYYEAIYVGKMLYDLTGESKYLEQSFKFAETSKSFALYSEIKDMEAMQFSDLPEDIKDKENRYMGEIHAYEELLYTEQIKAEPDSTLIESLKNEMFHLKDDYSYLKKEIEENYVNYYELKYNPKFVTLNDVQEKLSYRDALIEYVLSDTLLITYVVDRKGINVFSQQIEAEFADECMEYYTLLHNQNFSSGVHENFKRYVNLGRKFYRILVEPCLQYTDRKNLTIVPDGAITYIPFEGLITRDTETEYINYLKLPYLIKDYSIGYSHSSTLLFNERYKSKSPEDKVLAFAPNYKNPLNNMDTAQFRQVMADTDFLFPLVGTIKEVQSINETVPSKVFINENATESNFKKYASDYNVLHLAMHTIIKDDAPLYSLLAFTNKGSSDSDTVEDNKLYAYEIYNLKLNAQMTVLSSCNSGTGKMQKGEGMMSLARGFIYAGCPSIIMTLWQVTDKSSSQLMTSFYKYLKRGKSKQEAMRLAKIDYLETADDLTSNPYFWSGFVVLGDNSPIYRKSGLAYWMIVITLFVGLLIFFQYRRSRSN